MIISQFVEVLFLSFCCASILLIWLETNAVYEYIEYFNLGGFFICKYNNYKKQNKFSELNFPAFLLLNYNSFFVRLINCSVCLSFWINLLLNLIVFEITYFPFTFILSLFIYYLLVTFKNKI